MESADESAIRRLLWDHFEGLRWGAQTSPDWERFRGDFLAGAQLFGAARPVVGRSVDGFIERMETVARANLREFEEHTRGLKIMVSGNVAVALGVSELLENGSETSHDVSAFLLVKSEGRWAIAAHAWDQVKDLQRLPFDVMLRPDHPGAPPAVPSGRR